MSDRLTSSFAACLAWILKQDVPAPPGPDPWSFWRGWLAERELGLVPIENPREFSWAGPWIAVRKDGTAAVAFGPPPDLIHDPLETGAPFSAVVSGWLVAGFDVAGTGGPDPTRTEGTVEAIVIVRVKEGPVELVQQAEAIAGRGLVGDRYVDGAGTFSNPHGVGHDLTLVEAERMEQIGRRPELARRNIVTRGIDLNALVGENFTVGEATCIGRRLCEPCAHLQRITEPGIMRPLVHKAGLRADLLEGGRIAVGDRVRPS
jgi:hypothetical protein